MGTQRLKSLFIVTGLIQPNKWYQSYKEPRAIEEKPKDTILEPGRYTRKIIEKCISFYLDLKNRQRDQIECFKFEGQTEDSPNMIMSRQTIEWYEKNIRECQTLLEIRR